LDITEWLIQYLLDKTETPSVYNSIYLAAMDGSELVYDAKFRDYYSGVLTELYLSNRKFYGEDSEAEKAVARTVEGLVSYLEEHMLGGKKLVVVAHSQGNHMIELAYGVLSEKWGEDAMRAIQVVGVASVASTTPSNTYLTWDKDIVVLNGYDSGGDASPLAGNFSAVDTDFIENNHAFNKVYMSNSLMGRYQPNGQGNLDGIQSYLGNSGTNYSTSEWIIGLIKGSIGAAVPYTNEISSTSFITASLRWEKHLDMDLWINEDNQNTVSFEEPEGGFGGGLDRDDRDGEGPEHYTANLDCVDAKNREWEFGIQQYPNGGEAAIAHFTIKIANSVILQKSYSLNSWPSEINWIASIEFGDISEANNIPYTIIISDEIPIE